MCNVKELKLIDIIKAPGNIIANTVLSREKFTIEEIVPVIEKELKAVQLYASWDKTKVEDNAIKKIQVLMDNGYLRKHRTHFTVVGYVKK